MSSSLLLITAFNSIVALDPFSLILFPSQELKVDSTLSFSSSGRGVNLNGSDFYYDGYINRVDVIEKAGDAQLGFGVVDFSNSYHIKLSDDNYGLSTKQVSPYISFQAKAYQLSLSPDQWMITLNQAVNDVRFSASIQEQRNTIEFDIDSNKFDTNEQLDFMIKQKRCNASALWDVLQLNIDCTWLDGNIDFSGASVQYQQAPWLFDLKYQTNEYDMSDAWQNNTNILGKTDVNLKQQAWSASAKYKAWQLSYVYRTVDSGMVTQLNIQDALIAGIGKGKYFVIGDADFRQQMIVFTPPVLFTRWGQLSAPVGFAYFDKIDVHADFYEPILFFGFPALSETEALDIDSAILGVAQVDWQKSWQNWRLTGGISQLLPLSINTSNDDNDGSSESSSGSGASSSRNKKTGLFWPGFSLRFGVGWYY